MQEEPGWRVRAWAGVLGGGQVWPQDRDPASQGSLFLRGGRHLPLGTGNLRWAPGLEFRQVWVQLECQFVVL